MIFLLVPLILYAIYKKLVGSKKVKDLKGKHVVITGGSSGIGKSVAILAAKKGANVSIIARNENKLLEAKQEIQEACVSEDQVVTTKSVDVSNSNGVKLSLEELDQAAPIYMLINCAGMALCGKVEEFQEEDVKTLLEANFLGTLYPIQHIVPKMKQRKEGIIVLTGSGVSLMGMFGYSIYSSCKFALRGLAESISMELKPYNISVTLSLPPDTDTPGFENENRTKPEETKLISEAGGMVKPEVVAERLLQDALAGNFFSYIGFESFILTNLCIGMSPFANIFEVLLQSIILGPLRLISTYYIYSFENIVKKCHLAKEKNK